MIHSVSDPLLVRLIDNIQGISPDQGFILIPCIAGQGNDPIGKKGCFIDILFFPEYGNASGNGVDQMVHFHLCVFKVGNVVEHAVQQRASLVFADPFDLYPHPYNMPVPMLFAELKFIHAFALDHLQSPGYHHGRILFIGHLSRILPDHSLVFFHRITG